MTDAAARTALSLHHTDARAWHALGRAYKEQGDWDAALACYRRALAIEPRNPRSSPASVRLFTGSGNVTRPSAPTEKRWLHTPIMPGRAQVLRL